ncbi:MAG: ATPase, T2SS/T4P/T4SS family [bacterium]
MTALHHRLGDLIDQTGIHISDVYQPGQGIDEVAWKRLEQAAQEVVRQLPIPDGVDPDTAVAGVVAEALAIGPLTQLLDDPAVQRIMVNGTTLHVTRDGTTGDDGLRFSSAFQVLVAVARLIHGAGGTYDPDVPFAEAWLADGTRLHVAMPGVGGPYLTLDRPGRGHKTLDEMVAADTLSENMATFLRHALAAGRNVLVASNDVDARLELIAALLDAGLDKERVVIVESGGRLGRAHGERVVLTGGPGADNSTLVQQALKMRPDRLVVADARGPEAWYALSALGGAVNGGIIGIDAESPDDALIRLTRHASLAQGFEPSQVDAVIRDTADVLVQLLAYADGGAESPRSWTSTARSRRSTTASRPSAPTAASSPAGCRTRRASATPSTTRSSSSQSRQPTEGG